MGLPPAAVLISPSCAPCYATPTCEVGIAVAMQLAWHSGMQR